MPRVPHRFADLGVGFAPYLAPPSPDVVRLTVGEPGFDTPASIVEAAVAALRAGETKYTRGAGSESLCEAIAVQLRKQWSIPATMETVLVTPGGKQALMYAMMVTCDPGDEIILLAPAWPSYAGQVGLLGIRGVHVATDGKFHPDIEAIEAAITERTRAIIVNSPNNPTGAVYRSSELQALVDLAVRHDLWIISDEIYAQLVWCDWPHVSPASLPGGEERTIVITGFSKTWAMTGWRLGVMTGPAEVMAAAVRCQANSASHVPTFLMPAAEAALLEEDSVAHFQQQYRIRRDLLLNGLQSLEGIKAGEPEGAFYAFCDISGTGMSDIEFADLALSEAKVQLIPGSLIVGGSGNIRISYAADEAAITEGLSRLSRWLN